MPSDAKVPDPLPRGVTVPAFAAVVLVALAGAWGVGMFLLGRASAPAAVAGDHAQAATLGWLNRLDHSLAQNDLAGARAQADAPLPGDDALARTALALRRARIDALAATQAAAAEAAAPPAVLQRLRASLWSFAPSQLAPPAPVPPPAAPAVAEPAPVAQAPAAVTPAPLAEEKLAGEAFIPLARIGHPTLAQRAYAIHPARGLLRSDDGGTTWRAGLEPLRALLGTRLLFTAGEQPLLLVLGDTAWLFADGPDVYFP